MKKIIILLILFLNFTVYSQEDCDFIDVPRNILYERKEQDVKNVISGDYFKVIHEILNKESILKAIIYHFDKNDKSAVTPCIYTELVFSEKDRDRIKFIFKSKYPIYDKNTNTYRTSDSVKNDVCVCFFNEANEQLIFTVTCTKYKYLNKLTE